MHPKILWAGGGLIVEQFYKCQGKHHCLAPMTGPPRQKWAYYSTQLPLLIIGPPTGTKIKSMVNMAGEASDQTPPNIIGP